MKEETTHAGLNQTATASRVSGTVNEQAASVSRIRNPLRKAPIHLLLLGGAVLWVIPFVWMVSSSVQADFTVCRLSAGVHPEPVRIWTNYPKAVTSGPFFSWVFNSLRIAVLVTLGQLFTCSIAGYAFPRLRFPGEMRCS